MEAPPQAGDGRPVSRGPPGPVHRTELETNADRMDCEEAYFVFRLGDDEMARIGVDELTGWWIPDPDVITE